MIIAGKCSPEKEELEAARERGFEHIELYLEKQHLDRFEETLENCREADINVGSIHTPHLRIENKDYFLKADSLSQELEAQLVFHSKNIVLTTIPEIDEFGFKSEPTFENQPGSSIRYLEQLILDQGRKLALDTAHLYMATEDYIEETEKLIQDYSKQVPVIHLCDSTRAEVGVGFGEGEIEMEELCQRINNSKFDGIVVLEVSQDHQEDALQKWKSYTS